MNGSRRHQGSKSGLEVSGLTRDNVLSYPSGWNSARLDLLCDFRRKIVSLKNRCLGLLCFQMK